ncbi:phosphate butyryltransferase [Salinibacillus xinjiangensis]|uniref:Phosphate butyryltransferase n=1 Tax=Salinibacillus xinjiangensis TaxID=1229268 RepID=A0A6G1X6L3_9BACI|nr:phosphate butyryltransferase [Salinibacillus xinjiangensis]MRG86520.1 phosphate butyryltransferase [Salinibacillus xinjiangensis]
MKLTAMIEKLHQQNHKSVVAVAQAADREVLMAVKSAVEEQVSTFILFGDIQLIQKYAAEIELDLPSNDIQLVHTDDGDEAARLAVQKVHDQKAHVLMKGNLSTKQILKQVLHKEYGLRANRVLSHVAVFEVPNQNRLILLTDAAMNIAPSLSEKAQIIQNAANVANRIDIDMPKVAALAAVEVVNPAMQSTMDAAALSQMQKRGQIQGCIVDGPLAFDNAVSEKAAKEKGIHSDVAGQADILMVPSIETGNALYKSFMYFANAKVAAVISGAAAPIVLTSRADSHESKLYSIVLSVLTANTK